MFEVWWLFFYQIISYICHQLLRIDELLDRFLLYLVSTIKNRSFTVKNSKFTSVFFKCSHKDKHFFLKTKSKLKTTKLTLICSWIAFISSLTLFEYHSLQDKHFYFIKLSLTKSYLRKQSQSLRLILWILSVRLSTIFDNEPDINLALSINFCR